MPDFLRPPQASDAVGRCEAARHRQHNASQSRRRGGSLGHGFERKDVGL